MYIAKKSAFIHQDINPCVNFFSDFSELLLQQYIEMMNEKINIYAIKILQHDTIDWNALLKLKLVYESLSCF